MSGFIKWRYMLEHIEHKQFPSLHTAVYNGEIEKVKCILESLKTLKAQRQKLNEISLAVTPLDIAIAIQNEDIVHLLLQQSGICIDVLPGQSLPPLFRAAALPSTTIVQALLQTDININVQGENGFTALFTACKFGEANNIRLLLNSDNIKTDYVDLEGSTLLHIVCKGGHVNCLRILVQHGLFKHDVTDDDGFNPIERACQHNQFNVVRYFIEDFELNSLQKYL